MHSNYLAVAPGYVYRLLNEGHEGRPERWIFRDPNLGGGVSGHHRSIADAIETAISLNLIVIDVNAGKTVVSVEQDPRIILSK